MTVKETSPFLQRADGLDFAKSVDEQLQLGRGKNTCVGHHIQGEVDGETTLVGRGTVQQRLRIRQLKRLYLCTLLRIAFSK